MGWFLSNWEWVLLAFDVGEKVVKVTPTRYDDILLDVLWNGLKKLVRKG